MTTDRRLARIEESLTPRQAVLHWLTEAHGFPTLPAYVGWLIDQPPGAAPLVGIPEQLEVAVRQAHRGEARETVRQAVRDAVGEAVFLVHLVLRLNLAAKDDMRVKSLGWVALAMEMRVIDLENALDEAHGSASRGKSRDRGVERVTTLITTATAHLTGLYRSEEARRALEERYLEGRSSLFPELADEWETLVGRCEQLVVLAGDLGGFCGAGRPRARSSARTLRPTLDALRAAARADASAEIALRQDETRCAALDWLGETDRAAEVARRLLRAG